MSVSAVSPISLYPFSRTKNKTHLYDRDKQAWMLESDTTGEHLKLRLYYADVYNVPRRFTRHVSWSVSVVPVHGHEKPRRAKDAPFSNYYAQTEQDEGYMMSTDIPVSEVGL